MGRRFTRRVSPAVHELGIVFHIIREVEDVAAANGIHRVSAVTLALGEVSGVVPELLLDAWGWSRAKHAVVEHAELVLETVPAVSFCEDCRQEFGTVANGKTCPVCGGGNTYLVQGQEVQIREIEVPDEEGTAEDGATADDTRAPFAQASASPMDAVDAANPVHID